MPNVVSVAVVDDHPVRRMRLTRFLERDVFVSVAGVHTSLSSALPEIKASPPDVVILGGELSDQLGFSEFERLLLHLKIPLVPVWVFPFDRDQIKHFENKDSGAESQAFGKSADAMLLLQSIRGAVSSSTGALAPRRTLPQASIPDSVIAIGASTGGIEALFSVLGSFPEDCPPTLVVQHMRHEFTASLIKRMDKTLKPRVLPAVDGARLQAGHIYIAPGARTHLAVTRRMTCELVDGDPVSGHQPSVDVLFKSVADLAPRKKSCVGVLLTGMGSDGADGLLRIRQNGGHTIAQNKDSCVVYGMPRVAVEMGAAAEVLPLSRIGQAVLSVACR